MTENNSSYFKNEYEKYTLSKELKDNKYIVLEKKDTVAIINLKNHMLEDWQVYFQKVNSKSVNYCKKFYQKDKLLKQLDFSSEGEVIYESNYLNGVKNGLEIFYSNSRIIRKSYFKNDSVKNWQTFYTDGILKSEGFGGFTYRTGNLIEYYESGVIKRVIAFDNGRPVSCLNFNREAKITEVGGIDAYEEDVREAYSQGYKDIGRYMNLMKCDKVIFQNNGKPK